MTLVGAGSALLLCAALAGCATVAPPAMNTPAASKIERRAATSIDIAGRLSVRYQNNGKDEAIHGSFSWSQRESQTLVTLLSPLGQTLATIDIGPSQATLVQAGQPARSAADADTLAAAALGWPLPVAGLRDWLQGMAIGSDGKHVAATPETTAAITTSDGWQLLYPAWDTSVPVNSHPRRIDLARTTEQAGDVTIRIVIDSWQAL